jgi:hypothetical protein
VPSTDGATTAQGYRKFRYVTHESSQDAIIADKLAAPSAHNCDGRQIEFAVRATDGAKEIGAGSNSRIL